jgi:hypothetical protein
MMETGWKKYIAGNFFTIRKEITKRKFPSKETSEGN